MWIVGADIGQAQDPTAIVALEVSDWLDLRHIERMPLGTPYPAVVDRLVRLTAVLPGSALVIDSTGVGKPIIDSLRDRNRAPIAISITGGDEVRRGEDGSWRVPKSILVRALLTALEDGRLRIAGGLAYGKALERELAAFRAKIGQAGHASFGGVGEHDDLVIALALAVWWAEAAHRTFA
jgi:hypothetical protein